MFFDKIVCNFHWIWSKKMKSDSQQLILTNLKRQFSMLQLISQFLYTMKGRKSSFIWNDSEYQTNYTEDRESSGINCELVEKLSHRFLYIVSLQHWGNRTSTSKIVPYQGWPSGVGKIELVKRYTIQSLHFFQNLNFIPIRPLKYISYSMAREL